MLPRLRLPFRVAARPCLRQRSLTHLHRLRTRLRTPRVSLPLPGTLLLRGFPEYRRCHSPLLPARCTQAGVNTYPVPDNLVPRRPLPVLYPLPVPVVVNDVYCDFLPCDTDVGRLHFLICVIESVVGFAAPAIAAVIISSQPDYLLYPIRVTTFYWFR